MRYRFISCEVFTREVSIAIAESLNIIDPEFTPKGSHNEPDVLRAEIQDAINRADTNKHCNYDAILLGFGLCGNSLAGIKAGRLPLIIPRAHDCCTIFLGSKGSFLNYFGDNLSSTWSSEGFFERGGTLIGGVDPNSSLSMYNHEYKDIIEKYGEDNAAYIWEMLHPDTKKENIFISTPELKRMELFDMYKNTIEDDGTEPRLIIGNMRLIRILTDTNWLKSDDNGIRPYHDEFLYIEPGQSIQAVYDMNEIMHAL